MHAMNPKPHASAVWLAAVLAASPALAQDTKNGSIPGDNGRYDGDHLTLRTTVRGFKEPGVQNAPSHCAPAGAKLVVSREREGKLFVRFLQVEGETKAADGLCEAIPRVRYFTQYEIDKTAVEQFDVKRTGVTFGALMVPFKFRLGDNKIVSSATIAPYAGFRTGWLSSRGLTFTPLVSMGLGLLPVTDPATNESETRPALSAAAGFVIGSSKNEQFQAGLVIGRDYLGRADRALDPGSSKPWVSLYVGYTLSQN
jgi:hypothetical protein